MATRKIIDAKQNGEKVWLKGHAQATYMSDGTTVEDAINSIQVGSGGTVDTSNLATKDELAQKQDIISDINTIRTNAANYKGTITEVSANGTSIATSGIANIPAASTSAYGVTKLSSATNSNSTTLAATASAVKAAYDLADSYKGTVTSVKVDNVSKSQSSGVVDLGYINKQLSTSTSSSMTLSPNIYYRNTSTSLSSLTITLGSVSNSNIINEYFVEFTTRSAGTTVSLPSTIKWANGEAPTFEASTTYQISIVNNLGVVTKFK